MRRLERFLNLFTEVRPGEGATTLLLAANVFLILGAYYLVKPVREALVLAGGGAEVKSYAAAGQAVLLMGAVPLYGRLATHLPRRRLLNVVTLFFAACLVGFYVLARRVPPDRGMALGVAFFLWVGIFNLMVPTQLWAFANDLYTPEAGKRLFVLIAFGASSGAVAGSWAAGRLIEPIGVQRLMLVAAVVLTASLALTNAVDARARGGGGDAPHRPGGDRAGVPPGNAFALVARSRYLLLLAAFVLLLNFVNTTGEYVLGRVALAHAEQIATTAAAHGLDVEALIGEFYASFFAVVNLAGLLLQLFVVSRVLKYGGVRVAVAVLPALSLCGYALVAAAPLLAVVRWVKTAENATDYSLMSTVRQVLFLPTSRQEKYKAKQVVDTFCVRVGDVLSAALVFAGTSWLALDVRGFAAVNVALAAVWLGLALLVGREHARRLAARAPAPAPRAA